MTDETMKAALAAAVFEKVIEGQKLFIECHNYTCEPRSNTHEILVANVRYAQKVVYDALERPKEKADQRRFEAARRAMERSQSGK